MSTSPSPRSRARSPASGKADSSSPSNSLGEVGVLSTQLGDTAGSHAHLATDFDSYAENHQMFFRGGAAAGAVTPSNGSDVSAFRGLRYGGESNEDISTTTGSGEQTPVRGGTPAGHMVGTPSNDDARSQCESEESDSMLREYRSERMNDILNLGNSSSVSLGGSTNEQPTTPGRGRRASGTGMHSTSWLSGMTTETVEMMRRLEVELKRENSSRARDEPPSGFETAGLLDRARLVRVVRCKKTYDACRKAVPRFAALVDRLGLSLLTYDDVHHVLQHRCMAVPDVLAADGSNILYIVGKNLPFQGDTNMDATAFARAAVFLIDNIFTNNVHWTVVLDAAGLTPQKLQERSSLIKALRDLLMDVYPIRLNAILLYRINMGTGASAMASSLMMKALAVRYLNSKQRGRLVYAKSIKQIAPDPLVLSRSLHTVGLEATQLE